MRSKAAWGGGAIIITVSVLEHATGRSLSGFQYTVALLLAVIGAQFWHGLMQHEKMRPRIRVGNVQQHFWGLDAGRGSSGTGYYFDVFNCSATESLESVKAELILMEPDLIGILPTPLHLRHKDYLVTEAYINPGSFQQFDLATGPDHNSSPQDCIIVPQVIGGDRGYTYGHRLPSGRYRLTVRVSSKNCPFQDVIFEIWIEDNFLRCEIRGPNQPHQPVGVS